MNNAPQAVPPPGDFEIFPWNSNFATGIETIDQQHRELVRLINVLAAHLSDDSEALALDRVFGELAAYADYHFAAEEQIWGDAFGDDEWLKQHQAAHRSFLPQITRMKDANKHLSHTQGLERILKFLVNWLVFHILDNDRRMAKVVAGLSTGLSLEQARELAEQQMQGLMQTFIETILAMYEDLAGRSIELVRERNARIRAQQRLESAEATQSKLAGMVGTLEKTISALATTVEFRSPYTAGHQRRTAALVRAIATRMQLPADEIQGMFLATSIHDIGDMQVPSEILIKPGKLSDIEFRMVKEHPRVGYDILKDIEFPWPIAQIILQHHERLDGSGYPEGLKGDEILMGARVLAVADVVEAMSSHRPYRAACGIDAALDQVQKQRGTKFDPAVVDACVALFREQAFSFTG